MKCKCGAAVRITANGISQCWTCFDASQRQSDAQTATDWAKVFRSTNVATCGFCGQTECSNVCNDDGICDEQAFRLIWGGEALPHFRQANCGKDCITIEQKLSPSIVAMIGPTFV